MAKDNEQQTMEEYLLSQLDTPVVLKDGSTLMLSSSLCFFVCVFV